MDVDGDELTQDEQRLAASLAGLAREPTAERKARIMTAVRKSNQPRQAVFGRWRIALAGGATLVMLIASAVGGVAASGDALPSKPNYPLRVLGEQVRLALSDTTSREKLRISFAHARIDQARAALAHGNRADAEDLLRDSHEYLAATQRDIGNVPSEERSQINDQMNAAQSDEHAAETQVSQPQDHEPGDGVSNPPSDATPLPTADTTP
jgi:hypothetical protein